MDPNFNGFSASIDGFQLGNQSLPLFPDQTLDSGSRLRNNNCVNRNFGGDVHGVPPENTRTGLASSANCLSQNQKEHYAEDDFQDGVLNYINQILMEEDLEDKSYMLHESLDLQAAEKSLYETIGKKYPPSPEVIRSFFYQNDPSPDDNLSGNYSDPVSRSISISGSSFLFDKTSSTSWIDFTNVPREQGLSVSGYSQPSNSSSNSAISSVDGLGDSPTDVLQVSDLASDKQSIWHFRKGIEEATKFLPDSSEFIKNFELNAFSANEPNVGVHEVAATSERRDKAGYLSKRLSGGKNPHRDDGDNSEERSSKQPAVFAEPILRSEVFDVVLLCSDGEGKKCLEALQDALKDRRKQNLIQSGIVKFQNGGKGRVKKQNVKKEALDSRTLLISCAQAIATGDSKDASELLKQIRRYASPFGDGNERLAYCFADGLEARLAGTGSQIYRGFVSKKTSAADILKAFHLFIAACPFRKMSNFTSGKTILNVAENSMRLHVIDFGILYGFQWPILIQKLAKRPGGAPKLRITGIEFPQPGFRPAERVEETGRRLEAYAEAFKVPFEFNAIAKKWETVQIEELKIDRDEVLVVNCLYRFKNLLDETVAGDNSRNMVLNLIRKINPDLFIQGIINGSYNAPFFVTRFREAVFHFSALFDMLEAVVPREEPQRMLIEREIFGKEALNVIACEGWERVERPETYKQWQVRNLKAGFMQVPLDRVIVRGAIKKVKTNYHKDFLIDEDGHWLLQGWKGRVIYALSCWKSA